MELAINPCDPLAYDLVARNRLYDRCIITLRVSVIVVCAFMMFGGHYPPAEAQQVLTVEDAVQDRDIKALDGHLTATDAAILKQWESINTLQKDISALQGEERLFGGILSLLSASGIILQVRKKQV